MKDIIRSISHSFIFFYSIIILIDLTSCDPKFFDGEPGEQQEKWNLARYMPVAASGFLPDYPPENMVNGIEPPNCWSVEGGGNHWFEVYFDKPGIIERFELTVGKGYDGELIEVFGQEEDGQMMLLHQFKGLDWFLEDKLEFAPEKPWSNMKAIRLVSPESPPIICWRDLGLIGYIPGIIPPDFDLCGQVPDIIYHNGTVITMDARFPIAEAIAIRGNFITAVGSNEDILALERVTCPPPKIIDLDGKVIVPGFNDTHSHWLSWPTLTCTATGDTVDMELPLEQIMDSVISYGWTSISELGFGMPSSVPAHLDNSTRMDRAGDLHVRLNGYWNVLPDVAAFDELSASRPGRYYSRKVKNTGIKLYIDHPLGEHDNYTQAEVNALVQRAHDDGWQITGHAVNHSAVEKLLTAYELVLGPNSNDRRRHRIEHAVKVSDDQITRMANKSIIASIQLMGPPDWPVQESHINHISNTNPEWQMRWKDFVNAKSSGMKVVGNTDAPFNNTFCHYSPFRVIYQAVTRIGYVPRSLESWELSQRLTIREAMELLTADGAYASFDENYKGTLTAGKWADLVIIDQNPETVSPIEQLLEIQVLMTMVNGSAEYTKMGFEHLEP